MSQTVTVFVLKINELFGILKSKNNLELFIKRNKNKVFEAIASTLFQFSRRMT